MLNAKIIEEADELVAADGQHEVASEAADLIYFTLVKCVREGVSLEQVESFLDARACKVTRRPGLSKPQYEAHVASKSFGSNNFISPNPAPPTSSDAIPCEISDATTVEVIGANPTNRIIEAKIVLPLKSSFAGLTRWNKEDLTQQHYESLLTRPVMNFNQVVDTVRPILDAVRTGGDQALLHYTEKFDRVKLTHTVLHAPFEPFWHSKVSFKVTKAIDVALKNIKTFHEAQMNGAPELIETLPGVKCHQYHTAIERVGLYIPGERVMDFLRIDWRVGGTAVLPSTAMMLGVPAVVAGCRQIIFATPPRPDGSICPEVLYVASQLGVKTVVCGGGAQAIAAMAYGTETVPKVDKICGPGNQFVTCAKMLLQVCFRFHSRVVGG